MPNTTTAPKAHTYTVPRDKSTSLYRVEHDGQNTLTLTFINRKTGGPGFVYDYHVPVDLFHVLKNAERPGATFRGLLKNGTIPQHHAKRPFGK